MKTSIILFLSFLLFFSCGNNKPTKDKLKSKKTTITKLPNSLDEISGLSITYDGRFFCHDDERGIIYQIDIETGEIIKRFQLGKFGLDADFEGLAITDKKFFLISSNGRLYEFEEGKNLEKVSFKEYNLGFSINFEFEGLCYNSKANTLLIASKKYPGKLHTGNRAIYSFSLKNHKLNKSPLFLIPLKELSKKFGIKDFYPSGITIHQRSGDHYIISSKGQPSLVRISKGGKLLSAYKLDKKKFAQPEGIVFLSDSTLLISNEAKGKRATLVKLKLSGL